MDGGGRGGSVELGPSDREAVSRERIAGEAMALAITKYTFGIVTDHNGVEGRGIGTGTGVLWRGRRFILTANHVLADTPRERLYFFPPVHDPELAEASADWSGLPLQQRVRFEEGPEILVSALDDLAAIELPHLAGEVAAAGFYRLDERAVTPAIGTPVAYVGYPSDQARILRGSLSAAPFYNCSEILESKATFRNYDPERSFLAGFPSGEEIHARGFSGAGVWYAEPAGELVLAGIVTDYVERLRILIARRAERVVGFFGLTVGD